MSEYSDMQRIDALFADIESEPLPEYAKMKRTVVNLKTCSKNSKSIPMSTEKAVQGNTEIKKGGFL